MIRLLTTLILLLIAGLIALISWFWWQTSIGAVEPYDPVGLGYYHQYFFPKNAISLTYDGANVLRLALSAGGSIDLDLAAANLSAPVLQRIFADWQTTQTEKGILYLPPASCNYIVLDISANFDTGANVSNSFRSIHCESGLLPATIIENGA